MEGESLERGRGGRRVLARGGRWCWTTGASVWKPPWERCWQRGGDVWPWHKGVPSHACPTRAPVGAQHCHQPGWRFSSQFLAHDSLPMHRPGLGSHPRVPRQEHRVHTKPHPKCKAKPGMSSDAPSTPSNSHKLPQHLLAAHPQPRTPTGHRQGHPGLPQSVWYTFT